jgi:hypothetical protein
MYLSSESKYLVRAYFCCRSRTEKAKIVNILFSYAGCVSLTSLKVLQPRTISICKESDKTSPLLLFYSYREECFDDYTMLFMFFLRLYKDSVVNSSNTCKESLFCLTTSVLNKYSSTYRIDIWRASWIQNELPS